MLKTHCAETPPAVSYLFAGLRLKDLAVNRGLGLRAGSRTRGESRDSAFARTTPSAAARQWRARTECRSAGRERDRKGRKGKRLCGRREKVRMCESTPRLTPGNEGTRTQREKTDGCWREGNGGGGWERRKTEEEERGRWPAGRRRKRETCWGNRGVAERQTAFDSKEAKHQLERKLNRQVELT